MRTAIDIQRAMRNINRLNVIGFCPDADKRRDEDFDFFEKMADSDDDSDKSAYCSGSETEGSVTNPTVKSSVCTYQRSLAGFK